MANTVDTLGPEGTLRAIIDGSLTELVDENIITVKERGLSFHNNIDHIHLSKFENCIGVYMFANMSSLEYAVWPAYGGADNFGQWFVSDSSLRAVDIGGDANGTNQHRLVTYSFAYCTVLNTLILRSSHIWGLPAISVFKSSPFASGGSGGTIYVPQDLISEYQSATNWSTIYSSFPNVFQPIEGSQYENYYVDGTPINSVGGVILNFCIYILIKYMQLNFRKEVA